MATKDVSSPGRGAMIAAVASITLAVGITVAIVAGWVGRRSPGPTSAPATAEVATTSSAGPATTAPATAPELMPSSVAPGWVHGPTALVPIQPVQSAVGSQAATTDLPLVPVGDTGAAFADGTGDGRGGHHEGRRHHDDDDDDDREGDDD